MKVFELNFNPKSYYQKAKGTGAGFFRNLLSKKEKIVFDSFCFFPPEGMEKQFGYLFVLGEAKGKNPDKSLLSEIGKRLNASYFSHSRTSPCSQALKYSLAKANVFLEEKSRPFSFLNIGVISLSSDNVVNLSKIGNPNILLLSNGEAFDLAENISPASAQSFQNVVDGNLKPGDKIFMSTCEIFNAFLQADVFRDLAFINTNKELKKFLKEKKNDFVEIFGACLLIFIEPEKKQGLAKRLSAKKINFPSLKNKIVKAVLLIMALVIFLLAGYFLFQSI